MSENHMSGQPIVAAAAALALVAAVGATVAEASNQPNMDAAIDFLTQARASLVKATANKGGHRAKAIALIDEAIKEVRQGIRFANS